MSAVDFPSVINGRRSTAAGNPNNAFASSAAAAASASAAVTSAAPADGGDLLGGRVHRSVSNGSSTSSDILVAPAHPTSNSPSAATPAAAAAADMDGMETRSRVVARVHKNRFLVIQMKGYHNKQFFSRLIEGRAAGRRSSAVKQQQYHQANAPTSSSLAINNIMSTADPLDDKTVGNVGPNHRGTYSKQYIQQHPEIEWVHRGQGRYLPLTEAQKMNTAVTKGSSRIISQDMNLALDGRHSPSTSIKDQVRSGSGRQSSLETPHQRAGSNRQQESESLPSPASDQRQPRSSRLARRGKAAPSPETERRSSRVAATQNLSYYIKDNETEEDDDDVDVDSDMEDTYDKAYVDDHPEEDFYHTGNGWYKKGKRPAHRKFAKRRESEGHAINRDSNGDFTFKAGQTIHVSQLGNYPGVEFHHCGNGWYKPGPDSSGQRNSTVFTRNASNGNDNDDGDEHGDITVDKAYMRLHPEIDWVHRGNGRYRRRSAVELQSPSSQQPDYSAAGDRSLRPSNSIADEDLEEDEDEVPRRGSGRSTRGVVQTAAQTGRRRKSLPVDDGQLFSKKYVNEHPKEVFHHRGQGRYARGPRPKPVVDDEADEEEEEEEAEDFDEVLVDTEYVEAHPEETFHHRGQGRWARGLPPAGSSNKVAIRGPGARDRGEHSSRPIEDDQEYAGLPPPSALVLRSEGPAKWPKLKWYYRGGGKWARIAKHEWEQLQNNTYSRSKAQTRGLRNSTSSLQAQADQPHESAGTARQRRRRARALGEQTGDNMDLDMPKRDPLIRRPALNRGYSGLGKHAVSKANSSEAPTPKPRVMTLEEDPLDEADLPSLYKENYSPSDSEADDEAGRLYQMTFASMRNAELLLKPLTKYDPRTRPTETLHKLAEYGQDLLARMQEEYLESDKITAPHARIPRKPAKGGRLPVDPQVFEDKKEADLYDYHYDARKLGHQDPDHQRIFRDAEGRALRGRRQRTSALQANGTLPGWDFGDESVSSKRAVKPVNRFDGIVEPARKRARHSLNTGDGGVGTAVSSRAASMTPELRSSTPLGGPALANREYVPHTKGRWAGHIPKRIQELRKQSEQPPANTGPAAGSPASTTAAAAAQTLLPPPPPPPAPAPVVVTPAAAPTNATSINPAKANATASGGAGASTGASARGGSNAGSPAPSSTRREASPAGSVVRKGRPPGSKNLHKRRDAGIKKGPRKPKVGLGDSSVVGGVGGGSSVGSVDATSSVGSVGGSTGASTDRVGMHGSVAGSFGGGRGGV